MKKIITSMILLILLITLLAKPVYAVGNIIGPDVIFKDVNEIVTVSDIVNLYSSDGGTILVGDDEFTGKGHLIGNHNITLIATDGLIEKTKEITVSVRTNAIPDVTVGASTSNIFKMVGKSSSGFVFVTQVDYLITIEIIRDTLINLGELSVVEPSSRSIILNTYTDNYDVAGTYSLNFKIMDATGIVQSFNTQIRVLGSTGEWTPLDPGSNSGPFSLDMIGTIINIIISILVFAGVVFIFIKAYHIAKRKTGGRRI